MRVRNRSPVVRIRMSKISVKFDSLIFIGKQANFFLTLVSLYLIFIFINSIWLEMTNRIYIKNEDWTWLANRSFIKRDNVHFTNVFLKMSKFNTTDRCYLEGVTRRRN